MAKEGTYLWHIYDEELKKFFIWSGTVDYMYDSEHAERLPKFIRNFFIGVDLYVRWLRKPHELQRSQFRHYSPSYLLRSLHDEEDEYYNCYNTVSIHEEFSSLKEVQRYLKKAIKDDETGMPVRERTLQEFYEAYGFSVYKRVSVDECPDV